MHEPKTTASTRSGSSASSLKVSNSGLTNNRITSNSVSDNNNNSDQIRKGKKKSNRDKQSTSNDDAKSASVMSNLSSYSLIDDDHIDDQETINVGNLIIDLESDLEKEKIEHEQANHSGTENSSKVTLSTNVTNAPSSTSSTSSLSTKSNTNNKLGSTGSLDSKLNTAKSGQKVSNKQHQNSNSSASSTFTNNANSINNNGHATPRTIFKSSADERSELKMKITRETKPGKLEHRISANQKFPPNEVGIAPVNQNVCESDTVDDPGPTQSSMISSTKECGTSTSVGTITEPDCLGPCEPGTSVTLEGIVWQETDGGILVVNVTWRGKTYVGALLDCTRHDWAPPRLCDSPASDIDLKTSKVRGGKRFRGNGINNLDEKNLLQTTGKLRNGKGRRIPSANEPSPSCSKKQRDTPSNENAQAEFNTTQTSTLSNNSENSSLPTGIDNASVHHDSTSNILMDKGAPSSPLLIDCNEPNCSKKYRNLNGLLYHQAHAHGADNESSSTQEEKEESCSLSIRDRIENISDKNEISQEIQDESADLVDRISPDSCPPNDNKQQEDQESNQTQKRQRTPSPQPPPSKLNKLANPNMHSGVDGGSMNVPDLPNLSQVKKSEFERRHSNSPAHGISSARSGELDDQTHHAVQPGRPSDSQHNFSSSSGQHSSSRLSSNNNKQNNQLPPLPALTEEGMKPSGTSTGPPPAPHQANCYFNPTFLANTFNPYAFPPYFPRSMYDPMAPPTSNAAFLTRFMSNMRLPPPPSDSPSRLLSPSMPKNLPFSPFKVDSGVAPPPPPIPTSLGGHPIPNISPHVSNPQHPPPPNQAPPLAPGPPPLPPPMGSGSPNLRMPSQGDPLLPPTSQPPFLPPTSLSSVFGLPGMPNHLGPISGPQMPNLVDDLAKQFPRRFN